MHLPILLYVAFQKIKRPFSRRNASSLGFVGLELVTSLQWGDHADHLELTPWRNFQRKFTLRWTLGVQIGCLKSCDHFQAIKILNFHHGVSWDWKLFYRIGSRPFCQLRLWFSAAASIAEACITQDFAHSGHDILVGGHYNTKASWEECQTSCQAITDCTHWLVFWIFRKLKSYLDDP